MLPPLCLYLLDSLARHLSHPDPSAGFGKRLAIRRRIAIDDHTPVVVVIRDIAVGRVDAARVGCRGGALRQVASRRRVQGHPVRRLQVDAFKRVDLTAGRPGRGERGAPAGARKDVRGGGSEVKRISTNQGQRISTKQGQRISTKARPCESSYVASDGERRPFARLGQ